MRVETLESVSRNFKRRFPFSFLVRDAMGERGLKFSVIKGALMQIWKPPYIFKINTLKIILKIIPWKFRIFDCKNSGVIRW